MDTSDQALSVPQTGLGDAPRDPGVASACLQSYTEKDFEGHRAHTMYVGVHLPSSGSSGNKRRSHHRHHRRHRHHHPGITEESSVADNSAIPPSQRVQFILGEEQADGEEGDTHESHPLFSEMEELCFNQDGETEWNETARWVKFEEDVEEGGSRWSKPHVATLSLHSLFELRSLLLNGAVLLDAEALSLVQISDLAIDSMVNNGHLPFSSKDRLREILLRRHRHLYEKNKESSATKLPIIRSLADIGRNYSTSRTQLPHSKPSMTVMSIQEQDEDTITANTPMLKKMLGSTLNVPMMMSSSGGYDRLLMTILLQLALLLFLFHINYLT